MFDFYIGHFSDGAQGEIKGIQLNGSGSLIIARLDKQDACRETASLVGLVCPSIFKMNYCSRVTTSLLFTL